MSHQRAVAEAPQTVPAFLDGLVVAEYGDDVAVRYCGRLFAAMGARVVRTPSASDQRIGFAGEDGRLYGQWLDQGKQLLEPGELRKSQAHVVLGGLSPTALEAAQAHVARHDAAQALVLIRWFATTGPYAAWQGSDEIIAALGGLAFPFGEPGRAPTLAQGHIPQVTTGLIAFIAALASCMRREAATDLVEVNVLEATLCYGETGAVAAVVEEAQSSRLGVNRFNPTYPCGAYQAADGWVGITCLTPAQWSALCDAIGRPELVSQPRFATALARLDHADEVDAILDAPLRTRTTADWVRIGMQGRIPIAPMPHPADLPAQPHWRERKAFAPVGEGGFMGPFLPFRAAASPAPGHRDATAPRSAPLDGLRVLDFSMGWSGPLCTRILADLGAVVTKVESEGHPDWWRGWETGPEAVAERERRPGFLNMNRGKQGACIDLGTPGSRDAVQALAARADVVIENFAAGVMRKLGLGPDTFHGWNPDAVLVSMPGFGSDGEWSPIRAYGSTVEQASGMPYVNGEPHWRPALQHIALGDPVAGLYAAAGILAACFARHRYERVRLDLAQVACLFQLGADAILAEQRRGAPLARTGSRRDRLAFCSVVRCAGEEQWLAVVARNKSELVRLQARFGAGVEEQLASCAARLDASAAASELQRLGICAGAVRRASDLACCPQLLAGDYWNRIDRIFIGEHLVSGAPWTVNGKRPARLSPAPVLSGG